MGTRYSYWILTGSLFAVWDTLFLYAITTHHVPGVGDRLAGHPYPGADQGKHVRHAGMLVGIEHRTVLKKIIMKQKRIYICP
jgi:hypothetical protein